MCKTNLRSLQDCAGGTVDKSLGSRPGPGRVHVPQSSEPGGHGSRALTPEPGAAATAAEPQPALCSERPPRRAVRTKRGGGAPARHTWKRPVCSNKHPVQPKIKGLIVKTDN